MIRAKSLFFLLSVSQFFFFSCGVIKESNQSLCQLIPKVRIGNEVKALPPSALRGVNVVFTIFNEQAHLRPQYFRAIEIELLSREVKISSL